MKPSPHPRYPGLALLTLCSALLVQACGAEGSSPSAADEVRRSLTAAADAGSEATPTAAALAVQDAASAVPSLDSASSDVPTAGAGQFSTPVPAGQPTLPPGLEDLPKPLEDQFANEGEMPQDPEGTAIAQRATAEATLGIAEVDDLVMSMPKLATFTPAAPARLDAALVYVRGGAFWRFAAGGKPEKLKLDKEVGTLWAPPQDPGRAWTSPNGRLLMSFAGSDAEPFVTGIDGKGTRVIGPPALPVDQHKVSAGGGPEQDMRFKPGTNYTLVGGAGGERPFVVLADILDDERRGNARIRFVHAAGSLKDQQLEAQVGGNVFGGPMRFGRSSGELRLPAGKVKAAVTDASGKTLVDLGEIELQSKDLKTFFIVDGSPLKVIPVVYEAGESPGNGSLVRVFNAGSRPLTVSLDGKVKLSGDLAAGQAGPYARVDSILNTDQRSDIELAIYGNKTREYAVSWAPDSDRVAYLGANDGQLDLYVSDLKGPARRLTSDPAHQLNAVWAPDGTKLAWYNSEVSVILYGVQWANADGTGAKAVDFAAIRQAAGLTPTDKLFFPQDLVWVDAQRLALIPRTNAGSIGIWLYDTRSGGIQALTREPVHAVDWSPEAKAFVYTPDKDTGEIFRLDLDGKRRSLVKGQAFYPEWAPDGKRLTYVEGHQTDSKGWILHLMDGDGGNDKALSPRWPLVQAEPPVPGPRAKRVWLDGGKTLAFSRVGSDYGAADRAGIGRLQSAGPDIENYYAVAVEAPAKNPKQLTDLTQVFYLAELGESPDGKATAFIGLWYQSRTQQLWISPAGGGKPQQVDGPVRWFAWVP